jgi:hypothetical protein
MRLLWLHAHATDKVIVLEQSGTVLLRFIDTTPFCTSYASWTWICQRLNLAKRPQAEAASSTLA